MMATVSPEHPKQKLLFFVVSELDDEMRGRMQDFVANLTSKRRWLIGPPCFVHDRQTPQDASQDDAVVETVGGYLEIYVALPPWTLPREIDLQHLAEVETLVNEVRGFCLQHQLEMEFELDGKFVGAVIGGEMDRSLSVGLLGEWRRTLDSSAVPQ